MNGGNPVLGLRTADNTRKTRKTNTTMTRAPAAGLASNRWVRLTCRSRSVPGAGPAPAVDVAIEASARSRRGRTDARPLQVAPDSPAHEAQVSAGPSPRGR